MVSLITISTLADYAPASDQPERASSLTQGNPNATSVTVDVADRDAVSGLVQAADVVIRWIQSLNSVAAESYQSSITSLLPVPFHPIVAELCIEYRKHLVTASYISSAMRALNEQ